MIDLITLYKVIEKAKNNIKFSEAIMLIITLR